MNKKLLVTSALASSLIFLGGNAIAQTKIDGSLTLGYKQVYHDAAASKTADKNQIGREAQLNISNSGNLNVGGLKYAAGFALEFDGATEREVLGTGAPGATGGGANSSVSNENTYIDIIAGNTTFTIGVDHIQNSDRTTANFVGLNHEDLDNADNTFFRSSVGANPKESIGAGIMQKTPFGTVSALYVPNNQQSGGDDDLDRNYDQNAQSTNAQNKDRSSAYEIGFAGDLGIKGLNVHAFENKEKASPGAFNQSKDLKGQNFGVSYNFGQLTLGVDRKKSEGIYGSDTTTNQNQRDAVITQTAFGLAYALTPTLTVGGSYAKAKTANVATAVADDKFMGVAIGYNLGPVVAEAQYGQYENPKGVSTDADYDVFYARLSTKF
jgi:hypothetical protein